VVEDLLVPRSRSQSFVPLDQRSENESSGSIDREHPFSNNNRNNRILHIRFYCAVRSLHLWYLWRMPEMDAPRALVSRPLVKGNEALGTRLDLLTKTLSSLLDPLKLAGLNNHSPYHYSYISTEFIYCLTSLHFRFA